MPRYRHAVLGGTFDHFHVGHAAMLDRAFHVGTRVSIGVTTDAFLAAHPKPWPGELQTYATRRRAVARWIRARYPRRTVRIVALANVFGRSIEAGVDALVVSADTQAGGRAVNAERRRLGRRSIPLEVVPVVLADDLRPVSSRRIRAGEIDPRGRRLAPLRVGVRVSDRGDLDPVRSAVHRALPAAIVTAGTGLRGTGRPTARRRAQGLAQAAVAKDDLGVGVARRAGGGWEIVEASPNFELAPKRVRAVSSSGLSRAVVALLRPDLGRPRSPSLHSSSATSLRP